MKKILGKLRLSRRKKLLLDECVTRRVIARQQNPAKITLQHSTDTAGLGWGAPDRLIKEYAIQEGFVLVTRDMGLLGRCLEQGVKTAYYYKGKAYVLKLEEKIEIGLNADDLGFVAP